jgi:hypothetical protein
MDGKPVAGARGVIPRGLALVVGCLLAAGCYAMVPVAGTAPPLGARVALLVNDAGRVALGGTVGPEVAELEGRLVDQDSAQLVLSMLAVRPLRGGVQVWSGERLAVSRAHVALLQERHLSKSKSAIVAGAVTAALAAVIRQGILGGGSIDPTVTPPDSAQSVRIPWP